MTQVLAGKVALITGGSSGIGLGVATRFAAEGAQVVVTGRRQAELEAAVERIGQDAVGVRADVSVLSDLDVLYAEIRERFGHLDIVLANAGGGEFASLEEISEEHYDKTFDTNVKGLLFTVQKALPLLREGSSIILTGSTNSVQGAPSFSVYGASKAAVRNFARSWILDLRGRGIRVNVLTPGPIETPGLTGLVPAEHRSGFLEQFTQSIPLGRVGQPAEVASAALFLASDASSFVNGAELFVDGGLAQS